MALQWIAVEWCMFVILEIKYSRLKLYVRYFHVFLNVVCVQLHYIAIRMKAKYKVIKTVSWHQHEQRY